MSTSHRCLPVKFRRKCYISSFQSIPARPDISLCMVTWARGSCSSNDNVIMTCSYDSRDCQVTSACRNCQDSRLVVRKQKYFLSSLPKNTSYRQVVTAASKHAYPENRKTAVSCLTSLRSTCIYILRGGRLALVAIPGRFRMDIFLHDTGW